MNIRPTVDRKQVIHGRKPSNVAELREFLKEEWAKTPPQRCKILIACYHKQLLLPYQLLGLVDSTIHQRSCHDWAQLDTFVLS